MFLCYIDLSAAFDTVDHCVHIEVMKARFGEEGNALAWVADFLSSSSQCVRSRNVKSEESALHFGVPQGSVLGPRIFNQHAEDVSELSNQHHIRHHLFADDMQCYCSGRPAEAPVMVSRLQRCIADVSAWCASRRLPLPSNRQHLSYGDCLEGKRGDYLTSSVLLCIIIVHIICTPI